MTPNCRSFAQSSLCFARKKRRGALLLLLLASSSLHLERGTKTRRRRERPRPAVEREKERVVDAMPAFETSNAAAADAQSFGIRSDWRDDDGNNNTSSSSLLAKPIKTVKDKFELLPAFLKVRGLGTTTTLVSRAHSFGLVSLCSYVRRGPTRTDM